VTNTNLNSDYRHDIRSFLENFIGEEDFSDEDDIFELGLVSSLMAMQLVLFVEKALDTRVESEDLDLDNFRSIARMDAFMRKLSAPAHG
jgi:methoxymalonate biosynthesis acyl carrier protein